MTTFIIAPTDHAANTAVSAVRKSLESRPYLHFILVRGKQQGKGIAFSHIDMARCGRAVQADCCRHFVGSAAPPAHYGRLYFCICQDSQTAF